MKLIIHTKEKRIEKINLILAQIVDSSRGNPDFKKYYNITSKDVEAIERFRIALVGSFLNSQERAARQRITEAGKINKPKT